MSAIGALCVITAVVVPSSRLTRSSTLSTSRPVCRVERAGGLVAEQHVRALGDGARDGDALLLAAGELRREVVQPLAEADQRQRLLGAHRVRAISVTSATFSRAVRLGIRL
jgi:hypothetical protein